MTRFERPSRGGPRGRRPPPPVDRTPPKVIHEDDAILVVDKPPGWLVVRSPKSEARTLTDWVLARARREATGRSSPKLKVVNELDAAASGLVVFAKSPEAFDALKRQFRTKRPHRLALAVVRGHPKLESDEGCSLKGTIRRALARPQSRPRRGRAVDKPAVTHYRLIRAWPEGAALRLRLETSFPGQVEDHLRSIGCEIGRKREPGQPARIALHLSELGFLHPQSGMMVRYSSAAPLDVAEAFGERAPARSTTVPRQSPTADDRETGPPITKVVDQSGAAPSPKPPGAEQGWDHVAEWYDTLIAERRSDHFDELIVPGVVRLLSPTPGEQILDVACGQGEVCRALARTGANLTGVDASPALLASARDRSDAGIRFLEGDARTLGTLGLEPFDAASCVMALMNIDPIEPVFGSLAQVIRPGGRVVVVVLHPAFRPAGHSSWAWSEDGGATVQERRVRRYLGGSVHEIVMNPGDQSEGAAPVTTTTFNRPIEHYVRAITGAGFVIDAMEEWASRRTSEPGPRAEAENAARREIPMFLAIRAIRASSNPAPEPRPVSPQGN